MDVLDLEGKQYVKSSVIARELGYTSDYVGQLCRSGKVDAKLFGRTWYVEKTSISGHKSTRYRSTNAVTKRSIKTHFDTDEAQSVAISSHPRRQLQTEATTHGKTPSYIHHALKSTYTSDTAELLPELSKGSSVHKNLKVDLADAQKIAVDSEGDSYNFDTPTLPEIRFKGRLKISAVEDAPEAASVAPQQEDEKNVPSSTKKNKDHSHHFHPREVKDFKHKKAVNQVISSKKKSGKTAHLEVHAQASSDPDEAYAVNVHTITQPQKTLRFAFLYSVISLFLGTLLSLTLFSVSSLVSVEEKVQDSKYFFETAPLHDLVTEFLSKLI